MDMVLAGLTWNTVLVYLNDMIIFSRTFEEHLARLTLVLERLGAANLKIRPSNCKCFQRRVTFLGYVVSAEGISTDPENVRAVHEWPTPRSVTEVRSYVGLCSYYRKLVAGFAQF